MLFLKWFGEHFISRKPPGKSLFILDGHASRCSTFEPLEPLADSGDIKILFLQVTQLRLFSQCTGISLSPLRSITLKQQ
jgi:hypothetical protein